MSGQTGTVVPGLRGWLAFLVRSALDLPATYREALARRRTRTLLLTALLVFGLVYPILNRLFFQTFSRNVFPLPFPEDAVVTFMMIFGIMAIGLNIVAGFAGLLDLGYVAFYAFGAYTAAFFASPHFGAWSFVLFSNAAAGAPGIHLPFWVIVPLAMLIAATLGVLLGAPTLRLRGDYLAIVTLGFGEIVPVVFKNLANVTLDLGPIHLVDANITGGNLGINPIDAPVFFGIKFGSSSGIAAVYLGMLLLAGAVLFARNLERSRMGRAWIAIREDEVAAEMMGINTVRTKLLAFGLGASFAGIAGAMQASYQGVTASDFFAFSTSILVLIMIIVGGIGNIWGVLVGTFDRLHRQDVPAVPRAALRRDQSGPAQPLPVQLPDLRAHPRGDDAVPTRGVHTEPPAGGGAPSRPAGSGVRHRGDHGRCGGGRRGHGRRPRRGAGGRDNRGGGSRRSSTGLGPAARRAIMTHASGTAALTGLVPDDEILVRARQVTKRFGGLTAVNAVDFDIPRGSIVSLIGPNGAGKTTFFNMITGAYTPTDGEIQFDHRNLVTRTGTRIKSLKPHQVTALGIGRTFQNIRLFGTMSAMDNIRVGLHVHLKSHWWDAVLRLPSMRAEEEQSIVRAEELLELVGLAGRGNVWARNLPYGDQRRLEIGRALATNPKLLLLDEPTAGMNSSETAEMTDFIRSLRNKLGVTILLIEHDMRVVMGISDRVTVLDYGEVIAEGSPDEVRANPRVIEAYLGRGAAEA